MSTQTLEPSRRLGLGCEGMSNDPISEETSLATIRAAIESGVGLLDTGDFYGMGDNENLIRRALADTDREAATLSVKFNGLRSPDGRFVGIEGRPEHVKNFLSYSLRRLGTDYVDVYRPSRLDPRVPVEETVGAIAELVDAGHVRHIGLSEVGSETIRRAAAVAPIADVQLEYSLFSRGPEEDILGTCAELGIAVTAYAVLGHGLLTGSYSPTPADARFKAHLPRFQGENLQTNLELVERLRVLADARDCTPAQLAKSDSIVPIVGSRRPERIPEMVAATHVRLSQDDITEIETAVPPTAVAGTRYAAPLMALLDSER